MSGEAQVASVVVPTPIAALRIDGASIDKASSTSGVLCQDFSLRASCSGLVRYLAERACAMQ